VYYSDPRGELLFFVKPEAVLRLVISTPQRVYKPGDLVDFKGENPESLERAHRCLDG